MTDEPLDLKNIAKMLRQKEARGYLGWIEPERLRMTRMVVEAGLSKELFKESAAKPVFYYLSCILALASVASKIRGAIIRDRESRGAGGTWNKPDLRDIALRRLTGAALLEMTVQLKLGVCNIGDLEVADDLIFYFAKACKIHQATLFAAVACSAHVFDAIKECGDKIYAGKPGEWPNDDFFVGLDEMERKAEKASADPWPVDCAREAISIAVVRFETLAQFRQDFPEPQIWGEYQGGGFATLQEFLLRSSTTSCALINWEPVHMQPADFAEQLTSGELPHDALPFDAISDNSFNRDHVVKVPVYMPKGEPFIHHLLRGALQDYKKSKIRGVGKLELSPVQYR
jgi:hypothetical protein